MFSFGVQKQIPLIMAAVACKRSSLHIIAMRRRVTPTGVTTKMMG